MADALTELLKITQEIEQRLTKRYDAEGRGLHGLLNSVDGRLPEPLVRRIRQIATIRNHAVHEDVAEAERNLEVVREANEYVSNALKYTEPALKKIGDAIDLLLEFSEEIEQLLVAKYHAKGSGLAEKLRSVVWKVSPEIQTLVREIQSYRTQALFKDVTAAYRFQTQIAEIVTELRVLIPQDVLMERQKNEEKTATTEDKEAALKIEELANHVEERFTKRFNAEGKNLREKLENVKGELTEPIINRIDKVVRTVGWVRANKRANAAEALESMQTAHDFLVDAFLYKNPALRKLSETVAKTEEIVAALEERLVREYHAKGANLKAKYESVRKKAPADLRAKARRLDDLLWQAKNVDLTTALRNKEEIERLAGEAQSLLDNALQTKPANQKTDRK